MICTTCISFFSTMVCAAEIGLTAMSGAFGSSDLQIKFIAITVVILIVWCVVLGICTLIIFNSIESNIPEYKSEGKVITIVLLTFLLFINTMPILFIQLYKKDHM